MLGLLGKDETIKNVYRLARLHDAESTLTDFDSLRIGYLSLLAEKQSHMPVNFTPDPFIRDPAIESKLVAAFSRNVVLNDLHQEQVIAPAADSIERDARLDRANKALEDLFSKDDDLRFVFELVMHSIFCRPSNRTDLGQLAHGGTSSGAIGCTWLSLVDQVSHNNLMEMYVHELTHNLLFIDELSFEQFDYDEIAKPENFARSAILLKQRPLDKVIHSIVVSTEILMARQSFLGCPDDLSVHPESDVLAHNALLAIDSLFELENIKDITSERLLDFANQCGEYCESISRRKLAQ